MSEEEYHRLLERAITQLPPESTRKERFVIPNPISEVSGNRTILYNLKEISDRLKRDRTRILKFLAGEFATSGTIDGDRAICKRQTIRCPVGAAPIRLCSPTTFRCRSDRR